MKSLGSPGILLFILFLLAGAVLGGILGEVLSDMPLGSSAPILLQHHEIINIQNVTLNLYIADIHFGIRLAPNLLSIIGIFAAVFIYRHVS